MDNKIDKNKHDTIIEKNNINPNDVVDEKTKMILRIVFIIWFVGSLFLTFYLMNIHPYFMIIGFGQYFLGFGIIILYNKHLTGLIPCILGLAMMVIPILTIIPQLNVNWDKVLPAIMIGVFLLIGIVLMVVPTIINKMKRNRNSVKVMAKVIDIIEDQFEGKVLYSPVYEYDFNSHTYRIDGNEYFKSNIPKINEIVELSINPNNPEERYDEYSEKFTRNALLFVGASFVVVGLFIIYIFIVSN